MIQTPTLTRSLSPTKPEHRGSSHFIYNALGVRIAAGILCLFFGLLLSPIIAAAAISFSSVSVVGNALRLGS
jgi:cation transport ATPase